MRVATWALAVLAVGAMACGGDKTGPELDPGILNFVMDGQSCSGANDIVMEIFVNGVSRGTASFDAGVPYGVQVDAGTHLASAKIVNTGIFFGQASVTVPSGGASSYVMFCA